MGQQYLLRELELEAHSYNPSLDKFVEIAVIIPCYNEELTVGKVIADFRQVLPHADIWVCDNNSSDKTAEVARAAGAKVLLETCQGKGAAVRRLFSNVDADIYVMVDGDATYDAESAPLLVDELVRGKLAMVNGARISTARSAYRNGHEFGNWMLTTLVRRSFGSVFTDMLSGYRVFSRAFVKSFPALSDGFEIETELTVHTLRLGLPSAEVQTPYYARPEGSESKLSTFRDGFRILRTISRMIRDEKPLEFFGFVSVILALLSVGLSVPIFLTFLETDLVPRLPTLFVAVGLGILSALSITVGLTLDTLSRLRIEQRRLSYLAMSDPNRSHSGRS